MQIFSLRKRARSSFWRYGSRSEVPWYWDLVVSAKWASPEPSASIRYIASEMMNYLSKKDRKFIGRVAVVQNAASELFHQIDPVGSEDDIAEYVNLNYRDIPIKSAYIILWQPPSPKKNRVRDPKAKAFRGAQKIRT